MKKHFTFQETYHLRMYLVQISLQRH